MNRNGEKSVDIHLDIAIDYPIEWSFRLVLRDLIQNFYDAIGTDDFGRDFSYKWNLSETKRTYNLEMSTKNHPFSYEWLTYVGGSSKTESSSEYIGKYGEGFKMAALRTVQLGGMELTMHSQGWQIQPVSYVEVIDDRKVEMLGYQYDEVEDDGVTMLTLSGIPVSESKTLENGLLDFFYKENILFGEKISEGAGYSIFHRSNITIPCEQKDEKLKGILYINHLARGRLDIPLVIDYKCDLSYDKRSRPTLSQDRTLRCLHECINKWTAQDSAEVLRILRPYWNDTISNMNDLDSKYYLICQLVRNVAEDRKMARSFFKEVKEFGFIEKKGSDTNRNHLIEETKRWWMSNRTKDLINPIFRLLGAENLVEVYINSKVDSYRKLNGIEKQRYGILSDAVAVVVPLILPKDIPEAVVNVSGMNSYDPLQFSERVYGKRNERAGRKYRINRLVMKEEDFAESRFKNSLVKLADSVLHIYGTSKSQKMNTLLTHLGQWILDNSEIIEKYENEWLSV